MKAKRMRVAEDIKAKLGSAEAFVAASASASIPERASTAETNAA
jgi:hypothetical protein